MASLLFKAAFSDVFNWELSFSKLVWKFKLSCSKIKPQGFLRMWIEEKKYGCSYLQEKRGTLNIWVHRLKRVLCLGQPEALQPQVNYGNIESAGCAWWGKVGISFYLFFGYSWQSKKNWNFDVNCEKLVFLVFNIAKHIFLAVLYFFGSWL